MQVSMQDCLSKRSLSRGMFCARPTPNVERLPPGKPEREGGGGQRPASYPLLKVDRSPQRKDVAPDPRRPHGGPAAHDRPRGACVRAAAHEPQQLCARPGVHRVRCLLRRHSSARRLRLLGLLTSTDFYQGRPSAARGGLTHLSYKRRTKLRARNRANH